MTDRASHVIGVWYTDYSKWKNMEAFIIVGIMDECKILCIVIMIAVLFRADPINVFYAV